MSIAAFVAAITTTFPQLADAEFSVSNTGWDSFALVAGGMVFKFPRHAAAEARLKREAALLAALRPHVQMKLPDLVLHHSCGLLFSSHPIIEGQHLLPSQYDALRDSARLDLAIKLACFFTDVHGVDQSMMVQAGAQPLAPWPDAASIAAKALPLLPLDAQEAYKIILETYSALAPDPYGVVFGMFDCHGWNMAFDHGLQRINGLYDFGDSGFGPLHLDFMTVAKISLRLALDVVDVYENNSGRKIDRQRIVTLSGMNRIIEVYEQSANAVTRPAVCDEAVKWLHESKAWQGLE